MMEDDLMSLIDAEISRLKGEIRALTRERDTAREQLVISQCRAEELEFCLDQARIVLNHFQVSLTAPDERRLAQGAMIASDMEVRA
jgi:hypothetical protein